MQYESNNPIEDRFNCHQFKEGFDGFYAAVFDGHVGWQVSEFAMRNLHLKMEKHLKDAKTDD